MRRCGDKLIAGGRPEKEFFSFWNGIIPYICSPKRDAQVAKPACRQAGW